MPPGLYHACLAVLSVSPNWLAAYCQPEQGDMCSLLALVKGDSGSPNMGVGTGSSPRVGTQTRMQTNLSNFCHLLASPQLLQEYALWGRGSWD